MSFYTASFSTIMLRFFFMTAIGILAGLTGHYLIGAILCLPLLLLSMMGVSFNGHSSTSEV